MDLLSYFRAEIDTVGRQWREVLAQIDESSARRRPVHNVNNVIWLTGHMTWAEDYFIVEIPSGRSFRRKEWDHLFDFTSEKIPEDQYPSFQDVRAEYTRVHAEVQKVLAGVNVHELHRPSNTQRRWFPTPAHAIAHQVTHGPYHYGQLMVLTRLLQSGKSG